jgi:hypothetical protein
LAAWSRDTPGSEKRSVLPQMLKITLSELELAELLEGAAVIVLDDNDEGEHVLNFDQFSTEDIELLEDGELAEIEIDGRFALVRLR